RRGVDRHDVVQVLWVQGHDRLDDLDLVPQALHERGAQRPVDQPTGEDRVLGRTALPAEEGAGGPARRAHALLDVDREGEEIEPFLGLLSGGGRGQDHRLAIEVYDGGPGRKLGETAGFEFESYGAELAVVNDGLGGMHTLHG